MTMNELDFEHVPLNDYALHTNECPKCGQLVVIGDSVVFQTNDLGFMTQMHEACVGGLS